MAIPHTRYTEDWPRTRRKNYVRTTAQLRLIWRADILAWCYDVLFQLPREWQPAILEAISSVLASKGSAWAAIVACRKAGKSRAAAIIALWFLSTRPNSLVYILAPIWSQVSDSIYAEVRQVWALSILPQLWPDWEVLESPRIKVPGFPLWRLIGLAAVDVQNIEGKHAPGGVCVLLDESKAISEDLRESIEGMTGEAGAETLVVALGTPGPPHGWFFRAFAEDRPFWDLHVRVTSYDIPRLVERAEKRRKRLGEENPWYRQQELAEFAGADEFTVLPLALIQAAIDRPIPAEEGWRRGMALDPAGRGVDDSVLGFGQGPVITKFQSWQGWDEMRTANHTAGQVRLFRPDFVMVDEVGIGAGIRSRVREILGQVSDSKRYAKLPRRRGDVRVIGYNSSHKARDSEQYENRKAEDLFALKERLEDGDASIPNHALLISQWSAYRWETTARGRTKIVDPEDSPDFGDAGIMLYAGMTRRPGARGKVIPWLAT